MRESKLPKVFSLLDQGGDSLILQLSTSMKIDFEYMRAVNSKFNDGSVRKLWAIVEFQLFERSVLLTT